MATPAQIEANRRNAQKSTGPKTAEGKARSKFNGLTHGLRATSAVLPDEDGDAFADSLARWIDDWSPATDDRRRLVERAATAAWQLTRCVRLETARLTERIEIAYADWDRREAATAARRFDQIATEPAATIATLETSRAGVDQLITAWQTLQSRASEPNGWTSPDDHHARFLNLLGYTPLDEADEARTLADASWRLLLSNRPDLARIDRTKPFPPALATQISAQLVHVAGAKLDDLHRLRSSLPDNSAARIQFAELAAFERLPEDEPFHRYEAHFDREFRTCLALLMKPTQADAPTEPNPTTRTPAPTEPNPPMRNPEDPPRSSLRPTLPRTQPSPTRGEGLSFPPSPLVGEGWGGGSPDHPENVDQRPAPTEPNPTARTPAPTKPNPSSSSGCERTQATPHGHPKPAVGQTDLAAEACTRLHSWFPGEVPDDLIATNAKDSQRHGT
jgi:hypothetical protein